MEIGETLLGLSLYSPTHMILQLTADERETLTRALKHAYRQGKLMHLIKEPTASFTTKQLDEMQSALACEALVTDGILCGDAYNRSALAAGTKVHALLQRFQCMGR